MYSSIFDVVVCESVYYISMFDSVTDAAAVLKSVRL